jgi:hypothetical protein
MYQNLVDLPFVFSDESRFCDGPDWHHILIRRGDMSYDALKPTNKFALQNVMVCGAIGFV